MALVTASRGEVDRLLDEIGVDPGFVELLDVCSARTLPVHIVSDGFDYCIRRILGRRNLNLLGRLTGSHIVSSVLRPAGRRWRATFASPREPCAHGCATCKPAAMERLTPEGALSVFVGDGISDTYAAARADIVFAKDKLAAFCENAAIPYEPYQTLAGVANGIERLRGAVLTRPRALSGKGSRTL